MGHERASITAEPECRDGKAPNTTGEAVKVEVYRSDVEELVDRARTGGRTRHAVVCRRQTVQILVPRRGTWETELDADTNDFHPSERASKCGSGTGRAKMNIRPSRRKAHRSE